MLLLFITNIIIIIITVMSSCVSYQYKLCSGIWHKMEGGLFSDVSIFIIYN